MPPARPEKEKRLKAILGFATELESQLPTATSSKGSTPLSEEVEKQINSFPGTFAISTSPRSDEIDNIGTRIWNHCTRLRRDCEVDKPQDPPAILLLARVFSFLLLDCAYQTGKSESSNIIRLMKAGIKAAKNCLEWKQSLLALKVLEKLAGYENLLKDPKSDKGENGTEDGQKLIAEYYVLRTALAWRQDKFDVAELMFKKSTSSLRNFDPHTTESMADVLYEMGKELFNTKQHQMAVKWLERAYEVLESQELDKLSMDACELRISIIQMSAKALLALNTSETAERARGLIKLLENEIGDKLIVLLLKLESITTQDGEAFDSNNYHDILQRMITTVSLNDNNFRLIMFHVRKLSEKSPSLACKALDNLLKLRLLDDGKEEWVEKAIITQLWIMVGQSDSMNVMQAVDKTLSSMASNLRQPLQPNAAHAAHMLLWKRIESAFAQGQHDVAEKWCQLALHELFVNSGELNIARISRKLLLCALARNNLGGAREIFSSMSDAAKCDPMTRFLMYKIAIRCSDVDLAAECLLIISTASTKDPSLMYACCLDAQQAGNKEQMLLALQIVLDKHSFNVTTSLHLPSLIRLIIGLMESLIEEYIKSGRAAQIVSTTEKMCSAFENACAALQKSRGPGEVANTIWTIDELDWFSKNSYNTAVRHLSTWHPRQSLRMLVCCIGFTNCYPADIGGQMYEDITLRRMFCEFSAATVLVSLARGEDNTEIRFQDYLLLRKHVDSFDELLQAKLEKIDEDAEQDLRRKLCVLAAFDFEAACQLKDWDSLPEAIVKADVCKNSQIYEVMADCILCSEAPTHVLVKTLKTIVNEVWSLDVLNVTKLAKYMRCLFQITLSESTEIAEQLLSQIINGAAQNAESEQPYPTEELEWIAIKAFNHAVDLYCRGQDESCRDWAAQALKVAHYCTDDGSLEKLLHTRLAMLHPGPK